MSTQDRVKRIVDKLFEVVPPARHPSPQPQASWASLKVGDVLLRTGQLPGLADKPRESGAQATSLWEVSWVTSQGANLVGYPNLGGDQRMTAGASLLLTDRDWQANGWRKLTKRQLNQLATGSLEVG